MMGPAWTTTTTRDGARFASLNVPGQQVWGTTHSYCASSVTYPKLQQQSACYWPFASWFYMHIIEGNAGAQWDYESLAPLSNHPNAQGAATKARHAMARKAQLTFLANVDDLPATPKLLIVPSAADGRRYVSENDLLVALCESAANFWNWLPCAMNGVFISGGEFTHSTPYSSIPYKHSADANTPTSSAHPEAESDQAAGCDYLWDSSRFEAGTEKQLAFTAEICRQSKLTHMASFWQFEDWESLLASYAAFTVPTAQTSAKAHGAAHAKPTKRSTPTAALMAVGL